MMVSNTAVYTTENPPKRVMGLCKLADIRGLRVEHDAPDFLSAAEGALMDGGRDMFASSQRFSSRASALQGSTYNILY